MLFRKGESAKDFHWWNTSSIFESSYGYAAGQPVLETVIAGIKSINPVMLDNYYIKNQLIFEFLKKQTVSVTQDAHLYGDGLAGEAKRIVDGLCDFTAWQDVDVPIANLLIGSKPATFLGVTFLEETKDELER